MLKRERERERERGERKQKRHLGTVIQSVSILSIFDDVKKHNFVSSIISAAKVSSDMDRLLRIGSYQGYQG